MRRYRATISFLMLPVAYLSFAAAGLLISGLIIQQTSELVRNLRIAILFVNIVAGAACGAVWFHVRRSTTYVDPVSDDPEPETRFQADKRGAFTLVELLVVIFLIAVLAGIAIMFFPNAASAQREARGAIAVQGWLNIAKQRALRDNAPRGVRFYLGTETINGVALPNMVKEASYIEQPDDYFAGVASTLAASGVDVLVTGADFTNGQTDQKLWTVQPGDYVELRGGGLMHRVTSVTGPTTLTINPPVAFPVPPTPNYRIMRSPRVAGDEKLTMPESVFIDAQTNVIFSNALPPTNLVNDGTGFFDILFAPNGTVISKGITGHNLHLWIRAPKADQETELFRGEPTIVSVFTRTGFAGAYPPSPVNVTGVTNTPNPIVSLDSSHNLSAGSSVSIGGVFGAGGVNGMFQVIAVPSATQIQIAGPAPGVYAGGGALPYLLVK